MAVSAQTIGNGAGSVESPYAWLRLATSVLIGTIGSVGLWSYVVALPAVQADFGVTRADASLAYTLNMIGFGIGAVAIGGLVDRFGIVAPLIVSTLTLAVGFLASGLAPSLMIFALANFLIGIGSSGVFAPLIADISHWFTRRRGIAVAVCSSGNYIGGAVWPPIVQHLIVADGWRQSQIVIGFVCLLTILPLLIVLRRRLDAHQEEDADGSAAGARASLGLHPYALFGLLSIAGVGCCVAMSMPQVHIVAYCGDLGYGVARGAEMLSLMLGFGIVSRIGSGFVADRIGGLATLLIGSVMQAVALFLYLLFDGLTPLYVISALFGLFQGGIVPMYAIIVREYFPPRQAGTLVGLVITATIVGMALGGWMSGAIFDLTGSYWQAFANGVLWNLLNIAIVLFLMLRRRTRARQSRREPGDASPLPAGLSRVECAIKPQWASTDSRPSRRSSPFSTASASPICSCARASASWRRTWHARWRSTRLRSRRWPAPISSPTPPCRCRPACCSIGSGRGGRSRPCCCSRRWGRRCSLPEARRRR